MRSSLRLPEKTAHTAADGKISCPEKRTQIGQVKYGIPTESGFPDYKGEKTLRAENRGSDAAQSASIGLFQHGEQPGKNSIQKSLHRKIPRYAVQTEPETAGGDPCLQQENAYHKLRCTGQHSTGRGLRQKPLQHKEQGSSHHNKVQRIQLAYFLKGKDHGRPQTRCCARAVVIVAGHQKTGQRHEYGNCPRPQPRCPTWDSTTLRNATARSPCKDDISFLSVTRSSVLPQSAAAVFFSSVISIEKAACSVKKWCK